MTRVSSETVKHVKDKERRIFMIFDAGQGSRVAVSDIVGIECHSYMSPTS